MTRLLTPSGLPTLVNAPYAGHTAVIADYRRVLADTGC
jgi:hypothetical protein